MKGSNTFFRGGSLCPLQGGEELLTGRVQYLSFSEWKSYPRFEEWRREVLLFLGLYRRVFGLRYIFCVWGKELLFRLILCKNRKFW